MSKSHIPRPTRPTSRAFSFSFSYSIRVGAQRSQTRKIELHGFKGNFEAVLDGGQAELRPFDAPPFSKRGKEGVGGLDQPVKSYLGGDPPRGLRSAK
jgi:hypothetical protein